MVQEMGYESPRVTIFLAKKKDMIPKTEPFDEFHFAGSENGLFSTNFLVQKHMIFVWGSGPIYVVTPGAAITHL